MGWFLWGLRWFYGLGANGTDDGGLNDPKKEKDDILLWPGIYLEKNSGGKVVDE